MVLIRVPKATGVIDPNRPVNALLRAQVLHLQEAERVLPLKYRSEIYIHAIQTEGEAAEYIQQVTEAIHNAHEEAAKKRARRAPKRKPGIELAAMADEHAEKKAKSRPRTKKNMTEKNKQKSRKKKAKS